MPHRRRYGEQYEACERRADHKRNLDLPIRPLATFWFAFARGNVWFRSRTIIHNSDVTDEAVALADDGFEVMRRGRIIVQDLANLADGCVDASVDVNVNSVGPDGMDDLITSDECSSPAHQQREHLHRGLLQFDWAPRTDQLERSEVDDEIRQNCFFRHKDWLARRLYLPIHAKFSQSSGPLH